LTGKLKLTHTKSHWFTIGTE